MSFSKFDGKAAMSAVAMALAALASINCGTSSGSGSGGTGGQATSSTATGGAQATSTSTGMNDPACASTALCADVDLTDSTTCGGSGGSSGVGGAESMDGANARCILGKLRDRATGYMAISVDSGSPVPCGHVTELVSFGDGSVSISRRNYGDLAVNVEKSVRSELKPVGYFATCLAGDDTAAIACLASLTTGAVVAGDTCPCRGNGSGPLSAYCSVGQ